MYSTPTGNLDSLIKRKRDQRSLTLFQLSYDTHQKDIHRVKQEWQFSGLWDLFCFLLNSGDTPTGVWGKNN